jgi:hypothetical protein
VTHYGFPGLAVVNSDLMCVYREGPQHDVDTGATRGIIYRETSTDDGATWGTKTAVVDDSSGQLDARDPTMLVTGASSVLVFYTLANSTGPDFDPYVARSTNNGTSWTQIAITNSFTDYALSAGCCVQAGNGNVLCALYGEDTGDTLASVRVSRSTDDGVTWAHLADVADGQGDSRNYTEPALIKLPNDDILCIIRNSTNSNFYSSLSTDDGATWSAPAVTLAAASGRPGPLVLSDGTIALWYRESAVATHGSIRYSYDDGATWSGPQRFHVATNQVVYAQMVEDIADQMAVIYADETNSTTALVKFARFYRRD